MSRSRPQDVIDPDSKRERSMALISEPFGTVVDVLFIPSGCQRISLNASATLFPAILART